MEIVLRNEQLKLLNSMIFFVLLLHSIIFLTECALPEKVLFLTDSSTHVITSPGYPSECCKPMQYLLKKEVDRKYFKILFTDVDFPASSQLLIYGVEDDGIKVPLTAARYIEGSWIHPVVFYEGETILIEFHVQGSDTSSSGKKGITYVGFNGTFWADNDPWNLDKPLTFCPPIGSVMSGGRVTMGNMVPPLDRQHYRLYCMWQLKAVPDSDLSIYLNIQKLSGIDSKLKIHKGATSSSPVIYSTSEINSPLNINSTEGFYIELTKPTNDGDFVMTHGVFKAIQSGEKCSFTVGGESVDGYKCDTDRCIPKESKCNGIPDCSRAEDEFVNMCAMSTTTTALPSTTPEPCTMGRCKDGRCPKERNEKCLEDPCGTFHKRCRGTMLCVRRGQENCPGEPCTRSQRTCADGSCVFYYQSCKDGSKACSDTQRRCKNGLCKQSYQRCPEDPCASYAPIKCDSKCYSESIKCDGSWDCSSGFDERGCSNLQKIGFSFKKKKLWLLLAIPLAFILVALAIAKSKEKRGRNDRTGNTSERQPMCPSGPTRLVGGSTNGASTSLHTGPPTSTSRSPPTNTSDNSHNGPSNASLPDPSAPPSYGEVVNNSDLYVPVPADPPSYSSLSADQLAPAAEV